MFPTGFLFIRFALVYLGPQQAICTMWSCTLLHRFPEAAPSSLGVSYTLLWRHLFAMGAWASEIVCLFRLQQCGMHPTGVVPCVCMDVIGCSALFPRSMPPCCGAQMCSLSTVLVSAGKGITIHKHTDASRYHRKHVLSKLKTLHECFLSRYCMQKY